MEAHWVDRLNLLVDGCLAAGRTMANRIETDKQVTAKTSLSDVVTEVDKACEAAIRRLIGERAAGDAVLGEEGTAPGAAAAAAAVQEVAQAARLWIVDPLDGTTNFVQRMPLSVVSIAYAENGEVVLGGVYDPYRDELFFAVRNHGAYLLQAAAGAISAGAFQAPALPGRRLAASPVDTVRRAVVASGFPTRGVEKEASFARGIGVVRRAKSLRALGAAALELAYVAAGRLDGFWEYDLNAWDIAAGSLLVEEAGGTVEPIVGGAYQLSVRDVLACGTSRLAHEIRVELTGSESGQG
ncbi:MAG: inositol monophosphatase [Alicyclobacillus sp.]|nr:inositol monophosphatase [Alicyclobacillus sp.]